MDGPERRRRRPTLGRLRRWLGQSAQNAVEVARLGRLGPAYGAPYEVLDRDPVYRLRRYGSGERAGAPLLLIPPLMLTAEIYDVSPELSAVTALIGLGVDPWVCDFGAPEREEGGMSRTLDDHVRAVARAIDRVRALTGRDVHLCGYSQGGMFAYQAAAYRRAAGIASVITFGSPVDIHRNLPSVRADATAVLIRALRPIIARPLEHMEGLPGILTSTGFKLLTPRKEIEQLLDFVRKLHDRQALEKRESRRRFLGGEGFVAWPGPALRTFIDEFIVHNRMLSGGIVIEGRTVTLADITCPVLCFVGDRDDIARPAAVRAISRAAPDAEIHEVTLDAGHFGLVVGSRAMSESWPTVAAWVRWREGGPLPARLAPRERGHEAWSDEPEEAAFEDVGPELFWDFAAGAIGSAWERLGDVVKDASDALASARWQVPRLRELEAIEPDTMISAGRALAEQARSIPERTFFLWKGRAFSYAEADTRVTNVARGLVACGVRAGHRVAVVMEGRPSFLSMVTALNRIGAVAVLIGADTPDGALAAALALGEVHLCATDPENAARCRAAYGGDVLVLGGGGEARSLPGDVIDMEAIDPNGVALPEGFAPDPGRARDLALVLVTAGLGGAPRLAHITNHRWAISALGAAAACTLTPDDTVYCCLPLHHPAGILVSVGGALVGGSRLALAMRFDPAAFWAEARRYGATVVFYAGEMARALVNAPVAASEKSHPVRLFAGSGMRVDLWERMIERFGVGVLEFYASTTQNIVLANASGAKIGALGQPLPGGAEIRIARYDFESGSFARDGEGRLVRCGPGEEGVAIARATDGGVAGSTAEDRLIRDAFAPGDRWFVSNDVLRQDADGDYWYVDRLGGMVSTASGPVSCRRVESAFYRLPEVALAVACGVPAHGSRETVVAAIVLRAPLEAARLGETLVAELERWERPRRVRVASEIPVSAGYRPLDRWLRDADAAGGARVFQLTDEGDRYVEG